jgi:hypothetical protein
MNSFERTLACVVSVFSAGLLSAGAADAAVTIDALQIEVGGSTSALASAEVRDEDESPVVVTEVAPSIVREVTLTSTAPGGATATAETTLNATIVADEHGVQVNADISLEGRAASCDECAQVLSNATARPSVFFLMAVTITDAPMTLLWTGSAVSVLPAVPPFTVDGDATLFYEVRSEELGDAGLAILDCHANEFENPVFPCPTEAGNAAVLQPGSYVIRCDAMLGMSSFDSIADAVTPAEASSEMAWSFTLGAPALPEGSVEGDGDGEGSGDGEGAAEGEGEGQVEGEGEGQVEGSPEGDAEGDTEGSYEEGEGEGDAEHPAGCAASAGCNVNNPAKALGDLLLGIGLLAVMAVGHLFVVRNGS